MSLSALLSLSHMYGKSNSARYFGNINFPLINSVNFLCINFDSSVTIAWGQGKVGFAINVSKGRNTLTSMPRSRAHFWAGVNSSSL